MVMIDKEKEQCTAAENTEMQENAAAENIEAAAEENAAETSAAENTANAAGEQAGEVSVEETLRKEVAELKDALLRKEADFQNYRRRMAREVSDARRVGLVETIIPFLQVFDLFDMAMKAAEKSDNVAALKQGLEMILAQYGKTIDELGVQKFDAIGSTFDPMWHDAVAYENNEEAAEGVIIKQWNCGYKMGDKLLRPARVIVSSGPAAAEESETAETPAESKEQ
jgi:molecular chaperone GrpE